MHFLDDKFFVFHYLHKLQQWKVGTFCFTWLWNQPLKHPYSSFFITSNNVSKSWDFVIWKHSIMSNFRRIICACEWANHLRQAGKWRKPCIPHCQFFKKCFSIEKISVSLKYPNVSDVSNRMLRALWFMGVLKSASGDLLAEFYFIYC